MKFRDHEYKWTKPFTSTHHQWSFRGPKGGISFSASLIEGYEPACGLEFHHAFDPSGGKEAAQHARCWLLKAPCWHDGTSLYANEHLWPRIEGMIPDHNKIFRLLEREYESHFEGKNDE